MNYGKRKRIFPTATEDARAADICVSSPQTRSSAYRLAYSDVDFLLRDEVRPIRLQLELLKPELILQEHGIENTIIVFGSARIPDPEQAEKLLAEAQTLIDEDPSNKMLACKAKAMRALAANTRYYEEARRFSYLISQHAKNAEDFNAVIVTGGGPGIMEAANRGAHDAGVASVGLNIVLPYEQKPNEYITPGLCFQFHYFAIRKMHFLMRAKALIVFPGGYGTFDELFETLTLIQTLKIEPIPVIIFGEEFWKRVINFDMLVDEGLISQEDLDIFRYVETAEEAFHIVMENRE